MAVKKSGLEFNTTEFLKDFEKLTLKKYPQFAEKGIFSAMAQLKLDASNIYPKTPKSKGGGDLKSKTKIKTKTVAKEIEGSLTYVSKYAAYQHEGQRADGSHVVNNYTEAGSNKKFIEKKLTMFPGRYMKIIVDKIRKMGKF